MNSTSGSTRHLDGFEATVKDFWASRPRRPESGRKVAGVAAAVGTRYGIDPVVIRVALVALTFFGGVGPAVYLLCWLFFPGQDDEVSPFEGMLGHGRSGTSRGATLVLCALCLPAFGLAFGGTWFDGGGIIALALVVTALYLMHRSRGHLNRPPAHGPVTAAPTAKGSPVDTTSDDWDALGADPIGWDLADQTAPTPDPYRPPEEPEPSPPRRRRTKVTAVTLALAVIAAGISTLMLFNAADPAWDVAKILGVALAVIGGGLVAGSFLGGGRGLITFAVPLAIAGVVLTIVPVQGYGGGLGELSDAPTSAADVRPEYNRTAGNIDLDLTQLGTGSGSGSGETVTTRLRIGAGNATVLVPEQANVEFSCDTGTGNIDCLGTTADGVNPDTVTGTQQATTSGDHPDIHVTLEAGVGNVEVQRVR